MEMEFKNITCLSWRTNTKNPPLSDTVRDNGRHRQNSQSKKKKDILELWVNLHKIPWVI